MVELRNTFRLFLHREEQPTCTRPRFRAIMPHVPRSWPGPGFLPGPREPALEMPVYGRCLMLQKRYSPLFRMTLTLSFMLTLFLCTCIGQAHSPRRARFSRRAHSSSQASLMARMARQVIHYVGGRKPYVLLTPAAVLPYYSEDKDQLPTTIGSFSRRTPRGTVSVYWKIDAVLEDGSMVVRTGPNAASSEYSEPSVMHIAIISPKALPVVLEVQEPYGPGWLHVNGHRLSYFNTQSVPNNPVVKRVKLGGGLNLLQAGVDWAE